MSKAQVGWVLAVLFNVALSVTPGVPVAAWVGAWVLTAAVGLVWLYKHFTERAGSGPVSSEVINQGSLGDINPPMVRRKSGAEVRNELVELVSRSKNTLEREFYGVLGMPASLSRGRVSSWERDAKDLLGGLKDQSFKSRFEDIDLEKYPLPKDVGEGITPEAHRENHVAFMRPLYARRRLLEDVYEYLGRSVQV